MRIKFTNFPKEFKILKKELNEKFNKIGREGHYVLGKELEIFEKKVQKYLKVKHVLGVGNWTEGTVMILKALGYKSGDEISHYLKTVIDRAIKFFEECEEFEKCARLIKIISTLKIK